MALQEDEENMNANNIQDIMGEVEETTKEESMPGPINFNENVEEDVVYKIMGKKLK